MSYLKKLFGETSQRNEPATVSSAIEKLRHLEEMLTKKQEYLERKVEGELKIIKEHGTRNKRLSLSALKRKKRYEDALRKLDGTLASLELQRETLESARSNRTVLEAMQSASEALRSSQRDMDIDKVHDILDDIAEQAEISAEISQAVSQPPTLGLGGLFLDEDDLLKELEELEQEDLDRELLAVGAPSPPVLLVPSSPGTSGHPERLKVQDKSVQEEEEEEEIKKLKEWAT